MKRLLRLVRDLRWRRLRWSPASDKAFHDRLFAGQRFDPFSDSYPGYVTIRRFADLAAPHIGSTGTVLDLGCGPGEITCELARRFPATTFVGVDHSDGAIRQAEANRARLELTNTSFVASDLLTYVPGGRVQLVTMFDSFHHVLDPEALLSRIGATTDRFFLIEPAGNALGQWRDSHDFDWLAADMDAIREKLDAVFPARAPEPEGAAPTVHAASSDAAVERRYAYDDFERFFDGFTLTITGTSSGLVSYPPSPNRQTAWRDEFGQHVYSIYEALDRRLVAEGRDLRSRHWAITAVRGPKADRRTDSGGPLRLGPLLATGPYAAAYDAYTGPTSAPAGRRFDGLVRLTNTGSEMWAVEGDHPTNLSYRWLAANGVHVATDQIRTGLARPVAPGEHIDVSFAVLTPQEPGKYVLAVDLVREGVCWFSERGVPPLRVTFRITR